MANAPSKEEARSDAAKSRLIAAAIRVFHDKGYEQSSVQDVADAAGIVKGTLYYHVRSKEELLFEIMQQVLQSLVPQLEELARSPDLAIDKLRRFVEVYVAHIISNRQIMLIFFRDYDSLSETWQQQLVHARDVYDTFLRGVLRQGQREGNIRADLDVQLTDLALFGMLNWIGRWYRPDGRLAPPDIAQHVADLAVAAVASS
jgi:TetR/AcrR family transcriptional regulator, cholesterol catabolism regulator